MEVSLFHKRQKWAISLMLLLFMMFSLAACGGGGGDAGPGAQSGEQTYTISGQATLNGSGLANVTLSLTGAATAQTTTDGAGNYTFSGRSAGTYTITAALTGYSFTPPAINVTLINANMTGRNFTAVAGSSISGRVTENGAGLSGVTVSLTGTASLQAQTDTNGYYVFSGLANGSYTVTPSISGYAIHVVGNVWISNINLVVNNSNYAGQDFEAVKKYAVSGYVRNNSEGLEGVSVYIDAWPFPVVTNATGYYIFDVVMDGSHTVRVEKEGYWFKPSTQSINVSGADATADFEWRPLFGAKFLGAANDQSASWLSVDLNRNMYISGMATGNFDGQLASGQNAFIMKVSPTGGKDWTRLRLGAASGQQFGNAVDLSGNVTLSGHIVENRDLGGGIFIDYYVSYAEIYDAAGTSANYYKPLTGATALVSLTGRRIAHYGMPHVGVTKDAVACVIRPGDADCFAEITPGGSVTVAGTDNDLSGNIYISGNYNATFSPIPNLTGGDGYVSKILANGTVAWTRTFGTAAADVIHDHKVDAFGNVYVCGATSGVFSGELSAGGQDAFVAKYNADGVLQYIRQITTSGADYARGITVDAEGNIYITGATTGAWSGFSNAGFEDFYIMKLNSGGTAVWTRQLGTGANDSGVSIAIDTENTVVVLGKSLGNIDGAVNPGGQDFFIIKYDQDGNRR